MTTAPSGDSAATRSFLSMEPIRLSSPPGDKPDGGEETIDVLIVDDDRSLQTFLKHALTRAGYTWRCAPSGKVALDLLFEYTFRLVLVDIYMPEVDGFEVMIACASLNPAAQILAISGGSAFTSADCSLQPARFLGSRRVLKKPFDLEEFLSAVKALMDEQRGAGPSGDASPGASGKP